MVGKTWAQRFRYAVSFLSPAGIAAHVGRSCRARRPPAEDEVQPAPINEIAKPARRSSPELSGFRLEAVAQI